MVLTTGTEIPQNSSEKKAEPRPSGRQAGRQATRRNLLTLINVLEIELARLYIDLIMMVACG